MAVHDLGGGERRPIRFITNGEERMAMREHEPVMEYQAVSADPTDITGRAATFFRLSGGKWQFCVQFPSGAIQILSTEP